MARKSSKLRGRIVEILGTQEEFARKMGMDSTSVSKRITGKIEFKPSEISKAISILNISAIDIPVYFFPQEVGKTQPNSDNEQYAYNQKKKEGAI